MQKRIVACIKCYDKSLLATMFALSNKYTGGIPQRLDTDNVHSVVTTVVVTVLT